VHVFCVCFKKLNGTVILWELLTRKQFFGEVRWNSEIERLVQDGKRPPIPSDCPRL
jgi:hypothetical protein